MSDVHLTDLPTGHHVSQDAPLMSCIPANHFQQLVFPHYRKYRDLELWVPTLSRERLKHKLWALPCLPYLGFNQPEPLLSQQGFPLPKVLCENRERASGRSSTIAKKITWQSKKKEDKQSTQLKKSIFSRQGIQDPAVPLKEVVANMVSMMGSEAFNKNILEFTFYVLGVKESLNYR